MRSIASAAVLTASMLMWPAGLSAAGDPVACELLTQARVSAALGVAVGAGTPIARPGACQWAGKGRIATLTITLPRGGKTPVEQFNEGKTSRLGITTEPASGVGDDAFYVYFATTNTTKAVGIVVRKGASTFEIRVYGFPLEEGKTVGKSLAQDAAGKL